MEFIKEVYNYHTSLKYARIGDTLIMLFTLAGYYYIYQGKNALMKKIAIFPGAFYAIMVLNPLSSYLLRYEFATRMYRFLWIFPVALILGYMVIELLSYNLVVWKKIFLIVFLMAVTFFTQNSNVLSYPTENIYKVTDELIEVTDFLHQSGIKEEQAVFFENYNLYATVRQYDPTIRVPIISWSMPQGWKDTEKTEQMRIWRVFLEGIQEKGVEYLVLSQDVEIFSEMEEIEYLAETEKSKIYRINME